MAENNPGEFQPSDLNGSSRGLISRISGSARRRCRFRNFPSFPGWVFVGNGPLLEIFVTVGFMIRSV